MLTLCPGLDCPNAGECERHVRYRRRHEHPHACIYPIDRQPGRMATTQESVAGVLQPAVKQWACSEFTKREAVTS